MRFTYNTLKSLINSMTEEQRSEIVKVFDAGEFVNAELYEVDNGHFLGPPMAANEIEVREGTLELKDGEIRLYDPEGNCLDVCRKGDSAYRRQLAKFSKIPKFRKLS